MSNNLEINISKRLVTEVYSLADDPRIHSLKSDQFRDILKCGHFDKLINKKTYLHHSLSPLMYMNKVAKTLRMGNTSL